MIRLAVGLLRLVHRLPLPLLRALGAALGALLYLLAGERRRIVQAHIRACFPALAPAQQRRLARAVVRRFTQSVLDRTILWYGSAERIRRLVKLEGEEHLDACAGQPLILLAPHFVGMDAAGMRISADRPLATMYGKQKNAEVDRALYASRMRFKDAVVLSRQDGVRAALRVIRSGVPFFYLPDMDLGPRDAIFVPFFGVPAATVTAVSRLARLTGARVMPCVARMTAAGYTATIHPPWENYPGASVEEDTRRMNAFIEAEVRAMPEQYHWLHKRFKTRPSGAPPFYQI